MKLLCSCVLWLAVTMTASAQVIGWVELEHEVRRGASPEAHVKLGLEKRLGEKADLSTFTLIDQSYGETTVSYGRKVGMFHFAAGAGLETVAPYWRVTAAVSAQKGKFSGVFNPEHGASGFWYTSEFGYQINARWQTGFHSQRYEGTGVYVRRQCGSHMAVGLSALATRGGPVFIPSVSARF